MEVSASEIKLLCQRISNSLDGYTVSSLYSINQGILLRLRHETREEKLISISSFAPWITNKNLSLSQAEPFVARIKGEIERDRLLEVSLEGNERIATFAFQTRLGTRLLLHAEFFGGGNLILCDDTNKIMDVRKAQRFRHRSLIPGETYSLPPTRGKSLRDIDEEFLRAELSRAKFGAEKIDAIRWFGRLVATSRKFVEEIFFRSNVEPHSLATDISDQQMSILALKSVELALEIERSANGNLLVPEEKNGALDIDVCPIVPHTWVNYVERGLARIQQFNSFDEALDEAQAQSFLLERRSKASEEIRSKAEELESAIQKQDALLEKNTLDAKTLRKIASELMSDPSILDPVMIQGQLESLSILERDPIRNSEFRFSTEPRIFLNSIQTSSSLASRLFDEAKRLEVLNHEIESIKKKLITKRDNLRDQSKISEDRAAKRVSVERRPRQWFERYRWFLTSDARLAVGGRDSTSNSIIINKYMDESCLVFHADIHGSPFFLLKDAKNDDSVVMSQEIEQEMAQATVSFSRAWKDELGSADAFWVSPDQIKKSAPSGEYLPRGSFFIEGKKNTVKHLRLELSIGLALSEKILQEKSETSRQNYVIVMCGPEQSLSSYCFSHINIAPGKERASSIARKIKQLLISMVKVDENQPLLKELAKKVSVDEIIRCLPSGSFKIVSENKIIKNL